MKYKIKTIGLFTLLLLASLDTFSDNKKFNVTFQVETDVSNKDSVKNIVPIVTDLDGLKYLKSLVDNRWDYMQMDDLLKSLDSRAVDTTTFNSFVRSYNEEKGTFVETQSWVRILLFVLVGMVFGLIVYVFIFLYNKMDDESKRINHRIDQRKEDIKDLNERLKGLSNNSHNQGMSSIEKKVIDLQKKNDELLNKVVTLENMLREKNISFGMGSALNTNQQSTSRHNDSQKLLYADSIINGEFSHVRKQENDDTVFVLKLLSESKASILLYKQAYNKVLANASYLEGCEMQILGKSSVEVMNEGEAEAEMGSNGKWKVVIPLKVEIK